MNTDANARLTSVLIRVDPWLICGSGRRLGQVIRSRSVFLSGFIDRNDFRPFRAAVAILAAVRQLWPAEFAWLPPPYEYENVKPPIDILFGSARLREMLDTRAGDLQSADLDESCALDDRAWHKRTADFRIYP